MIPMTARIQLKHGRFGIRLWVPLLLLWLLLAPLVLVLLPVLFVACALVRLNPFQVVAVAARVLDALRGTHIEFLDPDHHVLIHLN